MVKKTIDSMKTKPTSRIISWEAPEFIYFEKNMNWYIVLFTVGIALVVAFYFMQDYLAITVVVLGVIIMMIMAKQKPKKILYSLTKQGFKINDKFYLMNEFKSFFVTYVKNTPNLHFEKTKKFSAPVNALLINVESNKVIDFIKHYLPENTKITVTSSDLFSNWFKF